MSVKNPKRSYYTELVDMDFVNIAHVEINKRTVLVRISTGGCIQKFPDLPPGAITPDGTALCH
jgi:hypothetical protein